MYYRIINQSYKCAGDPSLRIDKTIIRTASTDTDVDYSTYVQ